MKLEKTIKTADEYKKDLSELHTDLANQQKTDEIQLKSISNSKIARLKNKNRIMLLTNRTLLKKRTLDLLNSLSKFIDSRSKQIETLTNQALEHKQIDNSSKLINQEKQLTAFQDEKKQLNKKITSLQNEVKQIEQKDQIILEKERQIQDLEEKNENLLAEQKNEIQQLKAENLATQQHLKNEVTSLSLKVNALKNSLKLTQESLAISEDQNENRNLFFQSNNQPRQRTTSEKILKSIPSVGNITVGTFLIIRDLIISEWQPSEITTDLIIGGCLIILGALAGIYAIHQARQEHLQADKNLDEGQRRYGSFSSVGIH